MTHNAACNIPTGAWLKIMNGTYQQNFAPCAAWVFNSGDRNDYMSDIKDPGNTIDLERKTKRLLGHLQGGYESHLTILPS